MTVFQTFTAGQVLTAAQVTALQANSTKVAIFQEQKASGSGGGGVATTGSWAKRLLTDTVVNNIASCSIASSVIALTAGTYRVQASAPFFRLSSVQLKIRNTTAGTDLAFGTTGFGDTASNGGFIIVTLDGYFTLTGSTNIELQYYAAGPSINANDLGIGATTGSINVFGSLTLTQVA
jgi:hypothetical protein